MKMALMFARFESNSRKLRSETISKKGQSHIRAISILRPSDLGPLIPAIALWRDVFSPLFPWRWGQSVEGKGCPRPCSSLDIPIRFGSSVFHKVFNIRRGYR
jgi:hypothetical protein